MVMSSLGVGFSQQVSLDTRALWEAGGDQSSGHRATTHTAFQRCTCTPASLSFISCHCCVATVAAVVDIPLREDWRDGILSVIDIDFNWHHLDNLWNIGDGGIFSIGFFPFGNSLLMITAFRLACPSIMALCMAIASRYLNVVSEKLCFFQIHFYFAF